MSAVALPAALRGRDRYERVVEGRVDNTHDDALTHTVSITEPDRAVEVEIVALPSPTYAILVARARPLAGDIAPGVITGVGTLAGTAMVGGLTRRAAEATGPGPGATLVRDAVIEVARLARQVAKLPRELAERAAGDARQCWELDTTGWVDLPDSCFTYGPEGRTALQTRTVAVATTPDLYSPLPGQRGVFQRRKVMRVERRDGRLALYHAMHDNVHGFEIVYEIDLGSGRIVRAEHQTPRLPYAGICTEPQRKMAAMLGETLDDGLRRRVQAHLGGPSGCGQLYDLTSDLLRLLAERAE